MATDGGMRFRTPDMDVVYTAANGLETSNFSAVVVTENGGVYAVSQYGLIANLNGANGVWRILNRSYVGGNMKVVPGEVVEKDSVIVLAFERSLSFFSLSKESSIITIDRIGDQSLTVSRPNALAIHNDTLYVSMGKYVYSRYVDWKHIENDVSLIDPDSWTQVYYGDPVFSMGWGKNGLKTFTKHGTWYTDKNGKETSFFIDDSLVVLKGKNLDDPLLFKEGKNQIQWVESDGDKTFLVGANTVAMYKDGMIHDLTQYEPYQLTGIYEISSARMGGVMVASTDGRLAYSDGVVWGTPWTVIDNVGNNSEAYTNRMKVLSALPNGTFIYHVWGMGFFIYRNWSPEVIKAINSSEETCLDQIVPHYTVSSGTAVAPDSQGFFVALGTFEKYGLAYISEDGELSCANGVGSMQSTGPLLARPIDGSDDWHIYVGARDGLAAGSLGVLDVFTVSPPRKNGGRLVIKDMRSYTGLNGASIVDMTMDDKTNTLWLASVSGLGYWAEGQDSVMQPYSTKGLLSAEFTSIDVDGHSNVWLGTTTQGAFRLSKTGVSNDSLVSKHYVMKDGLLSNAVSDLAVDSKTGRIWFAHENGISLYQRNDLRDASDFMTDQAKIDVLVYPNPFRINYHNVVTFQGVAEDAVISIYNRGGTLVKSLYDQNVYGGMAEWDGRDKNGVYVAPGVYYYVIRNSRKTKKGKLIIMH